MKIIYAATSLLLLTNLACAKSYTATPQTMASILAKLNTGDTVNLTNGRYGKLTLDNRICFTIPGKPCPVAQNLTFVGPAAPGIANFDSVAAYYLTGLTLSRISITTLIDPAKQSSDSALLLSDLAGANILDSDISDQSPNILTVGRGIDVQNSKNVRIQGNKIHNVRRGIVVYTIPVKFKRPNLTVGVMILNNELVKIREDGVVMSGVDNATISGNLFHAFTPVHMNLNGVIIKDHPDYVQFFSTSGDPANTVQRTSNNIVISDNIMIKGYVSPYARLGDPAKSGSQGIFVRSYGAPTEQDYSNFTIQNNLIFENDGGNGIALDGMNKVSIQNNTVVHQTDGKYSVQIRLNRTSGISIGKNVVDRFAVNGILTLNPGAVFANPPGQPARYTTLFLNYAGATLAPTRSVGDIIKDLSAKPGGPLAAGQIGFIPNAATANWNNTLVIAP